MKTMYQTIRALAVPVVKHYLTDVTVHDRKACASMHTGDVAFWAPREMGSHFVVGHRRIDPIGPETLKSAQQSLEYFEACEKTYPGMQWYMLESTNGNYGHVVTVEAAYIREYFNRRIAAVEKAVGTAYPSSLIHEGG